jgi:radical SAM superfamily enzyme YgiQ (UPF0313 family)
MSSPSRRALLINPRFTGPRMIQFENWCRIMGARYFIAPLGLMTVAALLPASWQLRLVDRNVEELAVADIDWADIVLVGCLLTQQNDTLELIRLAKARGKPVVVGGPDVTLSPQVYEQADFRVLGEAESVMAEFLDAWFSGARSGIFEGKRFQADVTTSPVPRFDLINLERYLHVGVQFSRGCPFDCEFCEAVELFGHVPRTKAPQQMLGELDALYRTGYRGPVTFVDDNLVGNRKELHRLLVVLKDWQQKHGYPFDFSGQATVNVADDPVLLSLMCEANFVFVYFGIETLDPEVLVSTRKKHNAIRNLVDSVARVHAAGMFVVVGFVIGFDAEKASVASMMIEYVRSTSVTLVLANLLAALPGTRLSQRLGEEGRLHADAAFAPEVDIAVGGLNFETRRPRRDILVDYATVMEALYEPGAFFSRLAAEGRVVKRPALKKRMGFKRLGRDVGSLLRLIWQMTAQPHLRRHFWHAVADGARHNLRTLPYVVMFAGAYLDFGPYSRIIITRMRQQIELIDRGKVFRDTRSQYLAET